MMMLLTFPLGFVESNYRTITLCDQNISHFFGRNNWRSVWHPMKLLVVICHAESDHTRLGRETRGGETRGEI